MEPYTHSDRGRNVKSKEFLVVFDEFCTSKLLFLFTLFAFDALQFIFVVNVLQSPLPIPHPLKSFYLKKENDNVCELKGGVQ